jgi:branched-chain amino acid transport system permease protein
MGSLAGAFVASLLIGCMQTFSVSLDWSLAGLFSQLGWTIIPQTPLAAIWNVKLSQAAPVLPYLLMVLLLIFRPKGLMGTREG